MNYVSSDKGKISERDKILHIVLDVARKMSDPKVVRELSSSKESYIVINNMKILPWEDLSLSHGFPGMCLLFGELDSMFPNDGWDIIGHSFMLEIQHALENQGLLSTSTFSGLAGIGFAARSLSRGGSRYQKFIETINLALITQLEERLEQICSSKSSSVQMNDYDVIEGLSGIGRYLLFYKENPKIEVVLNELIKYLINMTYDITVKDYKVPGWFISKENLFLDSDRKANPTGNFNCGMAHGIPGPLAFLSLSLIHGIEIEGQKEAIEKIGEWLIKKTISNHNGLRFPSTVGFEEEINNYVQDSINRDGWCYGSPGVARSLQLAGHALNKKLLITIAEQTIYSVFQRNKKDWGLDSTTFCHGLSGLLHITNIMNYSMKSKELLQSCKTISKIIINEYKEEKPFGFQDIVSFSTNPTALDKAGLLDGSTGVLLALLAMYNQDSYTDWDALFMIN